MLWMLLLFLPILVRASLVKRQSSRAIRFAHSGALAILLSLGLAACFGNGTAALPPVRTTTGTYTITVTGTFTGTGGKHDARCASNAGGAVIFQRARAKVSGPPAPRRSVAAVRRLRLENLSRQIARMGSHCDQRGRRTRRRQSRLARRQGSRADRGDVVRCRIHHQQNVSARSERASHRRLSRLNRPPHLTRFHRNRHNVSRSGVRDVQRAGRRREHCGGRRHSQAAENPPLHSYPY